ncbi:hypothetical protein BDV93DRAFT_507705 [Ceratobasidium sp. AG-I]|nr:hypothetical protein BDV93DRAFT_507705 [Ceratobasidium sp. AG-I]
MDVAMPELIAADINQALLHDTNPSNSEYHWRIVWTESFFSTRSIALVPSLRIAPEYHLIQRGITREQSPVLRIKNKVPPQHSDTELSEGELTDYEGTLADSFLDNSSVRKIWQADAEKNKLTYMCSSEKEGRIKMCCLRSKQ